MKPMVSVLVAVLDEAPVIAAVTAAIRDQDYDGPMEFLFMDGGSTDGTRERLAGIAAEDARVRLLDNPGRTQDAALNLGLANARGEYVVQMDAHAYYPRSYVRVGVQRLERGDVEWVSGPAIPTGTGPWSRRVARALGSRLGNGGAQKWRVDTDGPEFELDTGVFGGIWAKSTLERLGGWDEGWPVNHDSELAARHLRAGGKILCIPEMGVRYNPRDSLPSLWRQYYRYGTYRARTSVRHPDSVRARHVLAAGLAPLVVSAALPSPLRRPAWLALGVYTSAITVEGARLGGDGGPAEVGALSSVFATMHLAWASGFVSGLVRPPRQG